MSEWFVDPTGRFEGRLFDGVKWTDQVSDNGVLRTDPDWPAEVRPEPIESAELDATNGFTGPEKRTGGDRRQVEMRTDQEQRHHERRTA